jgi:hypothetical protein
MKWNLGKGMLLAFILSAVSVQSAFAAYIDPNTGGMLFQLLAVLFGVFSGLVLLFSSRIKQAFFRVRRFVTGASEEVEEEPEMPEVAEE